MAKDPVKIEINEQWISELLGRLKPEVAAEAEAAVRDAIREFDTAASVKKFVTEIMVDELQRALERQLHTAFGKIRRQLVEGVRKAIQVEGDGITATAVAAATASLRSNPHAG